MALQLFKIETVEVASPVASVTFTSIPQGYTDLIVKVSARTNNNAVFDNAQVRFNSDSGSNYSRKIIASEGTGINNISATGNAAFFASYSLNGTTATASTFSNTEFYIPNYASSNYKSISVDSSVENNATTGYDGLAAGLWSSTSAITSIELAPSSGTAFLTNSTFTLYGVL
jgi:hypothetical protein